MLKCFFKHAKTTELFFLGSGALPSNKQMENVSQPLKGLENAEILQYLLCIWLFHRPHDLNLLVTFQAVSAPVTLLMVLCPFYFWSMW